MDRRRDERLGITTRKQQVLACRAYQDLEKGMEQGGMYSDTEAEDDMYSDSDEVGDSPPEKGDPGATREPSDQKAINREEAWLTLDEGITSPEPLPQDPLEYNPGTREIGLQGTWQQFEKSDWHAQT